MDQLIEIENLFVQYETEEGIVKAINGLNLSISKGTTLGLVGETGAGKTTLAKSIMQILPKANAKITGGEIIYNGKNLITMTEKEICKIRGNDISMIFQDPMTSLNPVIRVGDQIAETIRLHQRISAVEAERKAVEMLELVGIDASRFGDYPHQFSGGMKQRVVIAIALSCSPKVLIADEPTTALDVTIQAQVLDLMKGLQKKLGTSIVLITHDLGIVAQTCDLAAVIYSGEIVEMGTVQELFAEMYHPYTIGLMNSIPKINIEEDRLNPIPGMMPDPRDLPQGCKFYPRCTKAMNICKTECPSRTNVSDNHYFKCFFVAERVRSEHE